MIPAGDIYYFLYKIIVIFDCFATSLFVKIIMLMGIDFLV